MHSKTDDNRPENFGYEQGMPHTRAALADLLIKIRRGEAGYDLAAKFLDETTGAIAEAVARKGADVAIWLRKCNEELNETNVLPIDALENFRGLS
jgi:hypothetical protein